ncbi:uncharacterized protein [Venturia canescens]|uniref:uncharacterized protein n=1 Tax=Venturia canescens TaxID=32260 RepID=UPI001C9C1A23|nr:uncharacterized protein LOC122411624 [Venturia canescens]
MEEASLTNKLEDASEIKSSKIQDQCITSNWMLTQNNKRWSDAISIVTGFETTESLTVDDIVTEDSYVILQPVNANLDSKHEACVININLTGQKILKIGVVSEASVLEFFKESEEYAGTAFAELILEDEGATAYLADLNFSRPTSQASIKFTRVHNDSRSYMYLYGMRLVVENVTDSKSNQRLSLEDILSNSYGVNNALGKTALMVPPNMVDFADYDGNFSTEIDAFLRGFMEKTLSMRGERPKKKQESLKPVTQLANENSGSQTNKELQRDIESDIDKKLMDMEKRLMERMDELEKKTMEKLDIILNRVMLL